MTRADAVRQALESMEKTCAMLRAFLDEPEPAAAPPDEKPMTPGEVAGIERVSTSYVLRCIRAGELAASQLSPRVWRIERADYLDWKRRRLNTTRRGRA